MTYQSYYSDLYFPESNYPIQKNTGEQYGVESLFYCNEQNNTRWVSNSYEAMREADHGFYYQYYETGYWAYGYFGSAMN